MQSSSSRTRVNARCFRSRRLFTTGSCVKCADSVHMLVAASRAAARTPLPPPSAVLKVLHRPAPLPASTLASEAFGNANTQAGRNGAAAAGAVHAPAQPVSARVKELRRKLGDKIELIVRLFKRYDLNGNGQLDRAEFKASVRGVLELQSIDDEAACDRLFDDFDHDHSGEISHYECIRFMLLSVLQASVSRVISLFKLWDADCDGTVDKDEFLHGFETMGFDVKVMREAICQLFDELDEDGSGTLDYEELSRTLKRPGDSARQMAAEIHERCVERAEQAGLPSHESSHVPALTLALAATKFRSRALPRRPPDAIAAAARAAVEADTPSSLAQRAAAAPAQSDASVSLEDHPHVEGPSKSVWLGAYLNGLVAARVHRRRPPMNSVAVAEDLAFAQLPMQPSASSRGPQPTSSPLGTMQRANLARPRSAPGVAGPVNLARPRSAPGVAGSGPAGAAKVRRHDRSGDLSGVAFGIAHRSAPMLPPRPPPPNADLVGPQTSAKWRSSPSWPTIVPLSFSQQTIRVL